MSHVLENDRVRALIDPTRGARLTSLVLDGHEILGSAGGNDVDPEYADGVFPMVPWAGRIRDGILRVDGRTYDLPRSDDGNAIHGLARVATWDLVGPDTFEKTIGDPWPTQGTARLRYELLPDGIRVELTWDDGTDFPASIGLHPWFRRSIDGSDPVRLDLRPDVMVERGDDGLPTGCLVPPTEGPWDDCFRIEESPVLTWPAALTLRLSSSTDWWVVFTERQHAVCVEPQTTPPDAFDHESLQPTGAWPRELWLEMRVV